MPNLILLGCTVFEKNPILFCKKVNVARIVETSNFDIWDTTMLYFSESSQRLEHFYKVNRKVIIYAKFHVPRSHSIWEKLNPISCEKFNVTRIVVIKNFDIWDSAMLYFSKSSHRLEHFYKVYKKVNIYTKFDLCRSHRIKKKSNPNLQNSML